MFRFNIYIQIQMKYRWNDPCTVLIQGVLYESEEQDKS